MARTRVFKSGNSQAVRIPSEMAYPDAEMELEITRNGDVITIFPARQNLRELAEELRRLPRPPRAFHSTGQRPRPMVGSLRDAAGTDGKTTIG